MKPIKSILTLLIASLMVGLQAQTTIFFEDFESGALNPAFWTANPGPDNGLAAPFNSANSCGGGYHLRLGKTSYAGSVNLASVDLSLNLSAYVSSQLTLSFCSFSFYDQTQAADGVFASINGGTSFTKIISFNPNSWEQVSWGTRVPYDLDQLLKSAFGVVPNQVVLRFQQSGTGHFDGFYDYDSDGIGLDNVRITTERSVTYASVPYFENFSSNGFMPEWKISSREANDSLGANYLTRFPRVEIAGTDNSLHLGKTSYAEGNNLNAIDLHLKLGTYADSQLTLTFETFNFYDDDQPSLEGVFASIDQGASFRQIIQFDPLVWGPVWGERVPYDLDQSIKDAFNVSSLPDSLIMRFQQLGTGHFDGFYDYDSDGIVLDNIRISVEPPVRYASIPYFQTFETAVYGREYRIRSEQAVGQTTLSPSIAQLNRFYFNNVINTTNAVSGSYVVGLSKTSHEEGANLNALDLHLKLQGATRVNLNYWIYSYFDELQIDDGIWLSVDAGATFTKLYNFGLDTLPTTVWRLQSLDLSTMAAEKGLTLSDSTIIRFQQYGTGSFSSFYDNDGLFFDDISITGTPTSLDPQAAYSLKVFPNPSSGRFTVEVASESVAPLSIRVFNSLGQEVASENMPVPASQGSIEIDLSSQPAGVYQVRVDDGQQSLSRKIVVQR